MSTREARRVHEWFLYRGLPLVLTRRVRIRNLIERAAPAVGVVGAVIAAHDAAVWLSERPVGTRFPTALAALGAVLLLSAVGLPALRRAGGRGLWGAAAWAVLAVFVIGLPLASAGGDGWAVAGVPAAAAIAAGVVGLTYLGVGSIAQWALRFAVVQLGAMATLMSRALPLLMLTVMIFFTNEIWQLTARMSAERLWQTAGFLVLIAIAFMVATIRDEIRALRENRSARHDSVDLLAGTPLATAAEPARTPLSLGEQINVVAVMVVAQGIQAALFSVGLFGFFVALAVIAVPTDLMVLWSGETSCPGGGEPPCAASLFGIATSFPQTALYTSAFVAVLSGLYFTVSSSTDPMYRQRFFDPLVADVAVSLAGRDVYLQREAGHGAAGN